MILTQILKVLAGSGMEKLMKLEMICTGEEVLAGQIVDTNAAWCADRLLSEGIEMQRRLTVGDRLEDLVAAFQERSHHADVILVNGGLGPTTDDLSAQAMAEAKGEALVENAQWRTKMEDWYTKHQRTMPTSNLKQAMLPASAVMVDNPVGTACGFRVKLNRAWLYFTPGVPFEFKHMVEEQFIPFLQQEFQLGEPTRVEKLLTLGQGESNLQDILSACHLPDGITLGYRSSMPYIEIKLFARGQQAIAALAAITKQVKILLGDALVTAHYSSLAEAVHHLLLEKQQTLSIAESCTGGMLTSQLVAFPGSSAYLQQGLVTYSNAAKMKLLAVPELTLAQHGAVSLETAATMASGVRGLLDADFALATSGIAGPDGGSTEKPVGTVAISLATRQGVHCQMILLSRRTREQIRQMSCAVGYDMLRRALLALPVIADYGYITRTAERDFPAE